MLVDSSGTRTQHSHEHQSVNFAAYRLFHVFPGLALATFFPRFRWLNVSHALRWLHVFPRFLGAYLALVTCFPMLCAGFTFSRAYLGLVIRFPALTSHSLHVFPRLMLVTFFPRLLDTGLHVFSRLFSAVYMFTNEYWKLLLLLWYSQAYWKQTHIDFIPESSIKRISIWWWEQALDISQTGNLEFFWFFLNDLSVEYQWHNTQYFPLKINHFGNG